MTIPSPPYTFGQTFTHDGIGYVITSTSPLSFTQQGGIIPPAPPSVAVGSQNNLVGYIVTTAGTNTPAPHISGQWHIIGVTPTGAWSSHVNMLAYSDGSAWSFIEPVLGTHGIKQETGADLVYTWSGAEWVLDSSTVTNTTTNTVLLPDGNYGGVIVSGNGTILTPVGTTGTGSTTTTSSTSVNIVGQRWFSAAGFGSLTAHSQTLLFPNSAAFPFLPSDGMLQIDVEASAMIPLDAVELQLSFDDGLTWPAPKPNAQGIKLQRNLTPGASILPLEYVDVDEVDDRMWFSVTSAPTPNGLKYRFYTQGYYDVTASGPIALRLVSRGGFPVGATLKWLGVSFS